MPDVKIKVYWMLEGDVLHLAISDLSQLSRYQQIDFIITSLTDNEII